MQNKDMRLIDRFDMYARFSSLTDAIVTKECGLAIGTMGKSRKPGKDISRRTAALLLEHYTDLNREWFLNGEGAMLRSQRTPVGAVYPLIDMTKAECGRPGGLSDAIMSDTLPLISIPGVPRDTEFFIQASGYSMVNDTHPELSIPPGSFVGVSKIKEQPFMRWGDVYLVSTIDGLMIKRLLEDEDPEYVRCCSYNPSYSDFRLHKNEILECARITCVMPVYLR